MVNRKQLLDRATTQIRNVETGEVFKTLQQFNTRYQPYIQDAAGNRLIVAASDYKLYEVVQQ